MIQHRPYIHAKHMIVCHVEPLLLRNLQFHNFISLHYEAVYIVRVQRLAHFYGASEIWSVNVKERGQERKEGR